MNRLWSPRNPLIVLARLAERPTLWWLMLLITPAILAAGSLAVLVPDQDQLDELGIWQATLTLSGVLVLGFLPVLGVLYLWITRYERRPFWSVGLEQGGGLRKFGRGFLIALGMITGVVVLLLLTGHAELNSGTSNMRGWPAILPVLLLLIPWIIQGSTEEVLARGWHLPVIGVQLGPVAGIVISSLVFGLLHSLNPGLNLVGILNLLLIALFFCFYALSEGGLWGVCGFHAAWNWSQGNIYGVKVSGLSPGPSLVELEASGNDLFSGADFGIEGSLFASFMILFGIAAIFLLTRRSHDSRMR